MADKTLIRLRSGGIESVESESATVILDEQAERYFSTNAVGSILWKMLKDGTTREDLIEATLESFDGVERDDVEEDVDAYLARLDEFGLLEREAT